MAIQQDWSSSKLAVYLSYDKWQLVGAWSVLVGFDYTDEPVLLDPDALTSFESAFSHEDAIKYIKAMEETVYDLSDIWYSGDKDDEHERHPPSYFIKWALSKHFKPDWLDWAIENKLYIPEQKLIIENRYEGLTDKEIIEKIYGREPQLINSVIVDKPLSPRTENNYLRLIMQLANNVEGFNPIKPFEAAALIKASIDTNLSDKTIAGYIQKAHEIESKERD